MKSYNGTKCIVIFYYISLCFYCEFVKSTPTAVEQTDSVNECPSLENGDNHTQSEFFSMLVDPCRYEKHLIPPISPPTEVYVKCYIYYVEASARDDMMFNIHFLLQLRFHDQRLSYKDLSPKRKSIIGEEELYVHIWTPLIFLSNEEKSFVMGSDKKNVLVSINPDGDVLVNRRFQETFYCSMNLHKYPFDTQICSINLESWTYNASQVVLLWENEVAVALSPEAHISRFSIGDLWLTQTFIEADWKNPRHGGFTGNYSALVFNFKISRQFGYHVIEMFVPSCMIVIISWFSFWLQPDAISVRIGLGTTTMLSLITLATNQEKIAKVSYVKASEIWFLLCTGFIFASLLEVVYVYTIWRRKQSVLIKKVNSMNILKSTLTPRLARKEFAQSRSKPSMQIPRTSIGSSVSFKIPKAEESFLTVHTPAITPLPTIVTGYEDNNNDQKENIKESKKEHIWRTMSHQQITMLIDKKSRVLFPGAFLGFIFLYILFVYLY